MEVKDHRTIWIEKKEFPTKVPSLGFINERFGLWENLQKLLGNKTYNRYRWTNYSDD